MMPPLSGAEGEREAPEHPDDADQAKDEETVHDGREHILLANQTTVEEPQRWSHQQHQCCRGQYPCGIARVDLQESSLLPSSKLPTTRRQDRLWPDSRAGTADSGTCKLPIRWRA